MANYKTYNYDQMMMVPVVLSQQLMPGTLEYAIHHLVENCIDMSIFNRRYQNDFTGAPAYDPKILLKVILAGYSRGLVHSRKIENACRENIVFIALCCGKAPDYSTICNFVKYMETELISVFRDILFVCDKEGLLGGTRLALDGCKLPSNASQDWSGTHKQFENKLKRMEKKVKNILQKHITQDEQDRKDRPENANKQIKKLERNIKKIQSFLDSHEPKTGSKTEEVKSNITDNDSAQMMTSHGPIQGYNAQALVDSKHQIIVSCEASGDGQDHNHVPPLLDQAKANFQAIGKPENYLEGQELLCDASYHSQDNLSKSVQEKMDPYIPDVNYRKRDPRFIDKKKIRFSPADFAYDEENDQYVCPFGSALKLQCKNAKKGKKLYRKYVSNPSDCANCPLRSRCLAKEKTKRRHLYVYQDRAAEQLSRQIYQKLATEEGRAIYDTRASIVEPVFGNIRVQKRLDRFTLRGRTKVNIQWRLYVIIHNMEKLARYGSEKAFIPVMT